MEFREARKQLLVHKKAQEGKVPKKLGKAVNIFFRHPFMVRCVSTYLGPGELEYELKQLKDNFGLFYLRHEAQQQLLDTTLPFFSRRWDALTRIYVFQLHKMNWYEQNMDTCLHNLARIDARKEVVDITNYPTLPDNYGFQIGLYELHLFMSEIDTTIIDKASVMRFIKLINEKLKECLVQDIYDTIKTFECRLDLLSSFLRYNFDVETHLMKRIY
jgi:hypothetical protein